MKTLARVAGALVLALAAAPAAAQVYSFVANPQGSSNYSVSVAVSQVMDRKLGLQVRVVPMGGSSTFVPLLDRNEAEFGMLNVEESRAAFRGTSAFKRANPNLRLLSVMWPLTMSVMVTADSPIKSISELKGKRMPADFPSQTIGRTIQEALLANGGLKPSDIRPLPTASMFLGPDMVVNGRAEAASSSIQIAQVREAHANAASRGGVRFLSIDPSPEAMARMRKVFLAYPLRLDPAPDMPGIAAPTTIMAYDMFLLSNDKLSDDMAYKVAKMLHESHADLTKATPIMKRFNPKRMTTEIGVPYHPGAIRFFTEIGQWPPKG